jgi:hypothetical protein
MRPQFTKVPDLRFGRVLEIGKLPPGTPAPWIIDKIRKKEPQVERRIQPTVEVPDEETWRRWEQHKRDQERRPETERGVTIVDFTV